LARELSLPPPKTLLHLSTLLLATKKMAASMYCKKRFLSMAMGIAMIHGNRTAFLMF
jgi:hypothetical protein